MRHLIRHLRKQKLFRRSIVALAPSLSLLILTSSAKAAVLYFDPNGTGQVTAGSTYTWDTVTAEWSTSSTLSGTLVTWNSADAACFVAGSGFTGSITVDVNSTINAAGFFDGNLGPSGCNLTLAGTGSLALGSGAQAFGVGGSDGNTVTMDIPITDGPGGPAAPESEEDGVNSLYLYTPNTFTGGFILGASSSGSEAVCFNNSSAFGNGGTISSSSATATRVIATPLAAQTAGTLTLNQGLSLWNGILEYQGVSMAPVTITGNVALSTSGTTSTLQVQSTPDTGAGTATLTLSGVISGAGNLAKAGAGNLVISGANTYTGTTTVSAGTLALGSSGALGATSSLVLAGGTLDPQGNSQNVTGATLGLTASSTITFANGNATLDFGNSSALAWSGTLNLVNYDGANSIINVGSASGLTSAQLGDITDNGAGAGTAYLTSGGNLEFSTPVPEPSTFALGAIGALGFILRRRR